MNDLAPVPGHESLRFSGEPIAVVGPTKASLPRLARVGRDEAVLVYVDRAPHELVASRRIGSAFSAWPPDVGAPIERQRGETYNEAPEVVGFDDGTFTLWTPRGWFHAAADSADARYALPHRAFADLDAAGGVFSILHDAGGARLVHRSRRAEAAHVVELRPLPAKMLFTVGTATPGGNLILAFSTGKKGTTSLFSTAGGKRATTIPESGRLFVIPRPAGGAYLAVSPGNSTSVYALAEDGSVVGEPYTSREVTPSDGLVAFAPWRDGFVLAAVRGSTGIGVVVSDGTNATYGEGTIKGGLFQGCALTASPNGSVVLFAYADHPGIKEFARLACGAGDGRPVFVPAPVVQPVAKPAAPPAPAPSPFGTRDDVVRRIRQRRIVAALGPLLGSAFEGKSSGDTKAGLYEAHDGCGNFFIVHWDETGVVALGFDHDSPESEFAEPVLARRPEKHLGRVPEPVKALADRATEYGERLATEGFWIAAGGAPPHGESEFLDVLKQLEADDTGDVWLAGAEKIGALAGRMAASESSAVTPDDERAVLALAASRKPPLEAEHVARVAEALAKLGVVWPDAAAHAKATIDAGARAKAAIDAQRPPETSLSGPDGALLHAAHAGDLDAVNRALADGANVDASLPGRGGGESPLRIAASRGDVELCRRLLAAPGSRDTGPALDRLFYDAEHTLAFRAGAAQHPADVRSQASASDYAAILRLLLDAGAALPHEGICLGLARLAQEGGAADLVPRLFRVYAEDDPPVVPPLPDPAASREAISEGLARAAEAITRDTAVALEVLIRTWRASLHPRVGDAAEQLARRVRGEDLCYTGTRWQPKVDEAAYQAIRAACNVEPDPRSARAILWLAGPSTSASAARCQDAAAALLVHVRDGRFIEALEQRVGPANAWSRPPRASLCVALAAMKEVRPAVLSDEDIESIGVIEDVLAPRKPRPAGSKGPTTRDLFAAVYDDPDADAPRRALAERLVEAGDPRGEFIHLQLDRHARAGDVTKREKSLLKEHGRRWLGELAAILGDDVVFERGFLVEAATGEGRDPGAARCDILPVLASGAGTQVEWSTVRRLSLWRHAFRGAGGLLRGSRLRGLHEVIDVTLGELRSLLHGPPRPLARLEIANTRQHADPNFSLGEYEEELPEKLPELTHLRVPAPGARLDNLRRIALQLPKLRELSVGVQGLGLARSFAPPTIAELAAFATELGFTVQMLGKVDVAFAPASSTLEVSFPDVLRPDVAAAAAKMLADAGDAPIRRVVVKKPARTEAEEAGGAPPVLKRRKESLNLRPIYDAAAARGAACSLEDDEPFWGTRAP